MLDMKLAWQAQRRDTQQTLSESGRRGRALSRRCVRNLQSKPHLPCDLLDVPPKGDRNHSEDAAPHCTDPLSHELLLSKDLLDVGILERKREWRELEGLRVIYVHRCTQLELRRTSLGSRSARVVFEAGIRKLIRTNLYSYQKSSRQLGQLTGTCSKR